MYACMYVTCVCIYIYMCLPIYILNMYIDRAYMHTHICIYQLGVFSRTIKSLVCALGANSSMTEPTINSTLYAFIEQVNFYDLQKMVLQFAICFVHTVIYTYIVYTLYNKAKHLVQSSNMHFTIN